MKKINLFYIAGGIGAFIILISFLSKDGISPKLSEITIMECVGAVLTALALVPTLHKLHEQQKNTPTFKKFLKNHPIKQRTSGNPFDYRAGNIDLHGREEEQKRLRRFLDNRSKRVWAITGHGGMGKSKLAFHMALEYKREEWNVFWLTETTIKELKGCKIDTTGKHLFICDYAGRYVNEIAELLKRLHENQVDYKMLLLERAPYGSNTDSTNWFCKLRDNEAVKDLFQSQGLEYAENPSEPAPLNMTKHPLDDPAYGKILDDFSEKKLNEKQKREIIAFVRNGMRNKPHEARNEDNRCLFLLLAADVVMDGKSLQQLDKTKVFHSYIKKKLDSHFPPELEECKETALLLLVVATAGGAFDLREERADSAEAWRTELLEKLPQKTSAIAQVLAALCERVDDETTITPLYPDLLGEYLVMWYYYEYPKKELFPLLFSPDCSKHFEDFLKRICTDWYGNKNAQTFFADAKEWAEKNGTNNNKLLIAQVYHDVGLMLYHMLDSDAAIAQYNEAILLKIAAGGEKSPSLAATYNNLGAAYDGKGEYDKAVEQSEKALGIYEIHPAYKAHPATARTYNNLGAAYDAKGEYDKAIELYKKALGIKEQVYGKTHPETAGTYNNLGNAYVNKGEYDQAIELYEKALGIYEIHPAYKVHPETARTYNNLGDAYRGKGEYDKAVELCKKALDIQEQVYGEAHPVTAGIYNNLGNAYVNKGEYDKAIEQYKKALGIYETHPAYKAHPTTARTYNNLGAAYGAKGEHDKAIEQYKKALGIKEQVYGKAHPETANTYNNLAVAHLVLENYPQAYSYIVQAHDIYQDKLGQSHPRTINAAELRQLIESKLQNPE